jgi:ribosomal protein S18 acetylase RimI-like enzyme
VNPDDDGVVRLAGRGDAVMLHLIAAATFPLACPPSTPAEDIAEFIAKQLSVEKFRARLESDRRVLFIAEINGTPAGYAMISDHQKIEDDVAPLLSGVRTVELAKFYLLAGRHGSGLADKLMAAALDAARDRGAQSVWLGLDATNSRANSFYDRYGFERRGVRKFRVGDSLEDDMIRELIL